VDGLLQHRILKIGVMKSLSLPLGLIRFLPLLALIYFDLP